VVEAQLGVRFVDANTSEEVLEEALVVGDFYQWILAELDNSWRRQIEADVVWRDEVLVVESDAVRRSLDHTGKQNIIKIRLMKTVQSTVV
jgi:hypothetical protein